MQQTRVKSREPVVRIFFFIMSKGRALLVLGNAYLVVTAEEAMRTVETTIHAATFTSNGNGVAHENI